MNLVALALPLLMGLQPSVEAGLRTRADARGAGGIGGDRPSVLQGRLVPDLQLELEGVRSGFRLRWAPNLTWYDRMDQSRPFVLHETSLSWELEAGPRFTLFARGSGRIGEDTFIDYYAGEGTVDYIPRDRATYRPLNMAFANAEAGFRWRTGPRTEWAAFGWWQVHGGLDAEARETIPYNAGPGATLVLHQSLTPRDALHLEATGSAIRFDPGADWQVVTGEVGWAHQFTPHLSLTPRIGVLGIVDVVGAEVTQRAWPGAWLGYEQNFVLGGGHTLGLDGSFGLRPQLNRWAGTLEQRLGGNGGITWNRDRATAGFALGVWHVLYTTTDYEGSLGRANLFTRYRLVPDHVTAELGSSFYTQTFPGTTVLEQPSIWEVYLQMTFTTGAME